MELVLWQQCILVFTFCYSLIAFYLGFIHCRYKRNPYGLTPQFYALGAFVWGDTLVFGIFWMGIISVIYILSDLLLFLLIISVFWSIRGIGESIFWFNQQFSKIHRYPPHTLPGYSLFGDDSIWFVYQITAQCVSVIAIIFAIYFASLWLQAF